jgi:hypothetical protein
VIGWKKFYFSIAEYRPKMIIVVIIMKLTNTVCLKKGRWGEWVRENNRGGESVEGTVYTSMENHNDPLCTINEC